MRQLLILGFFYVALGLVQAQTPTNKNSIRVALEATRITVFPLQAPTLKYSVSYTKELANRHWRLEGGLSYINCFKREQFTPYDYYFKGDRSQRISLDFSMLFNLLNNNRHAVRVGVGPSFWYQRDGTIDDLTGFPTQDLQHLQAVYFSRFYLHEFNMALTFRGEYEFAITPQVIVGARAGVISSSILPVHNSTLLIGTLLTTGLSIGYRF